MNRKAFICVVATLLALTFQPLVAQDEIPETSGISGFAMFGSTYWNVRSNFFAGGDLVFFDEVEDSQISSIFDPPIKNSSPGIVVGGEINYTFSKTGTQLFMGNRLEDLLRLDLVVGLGVRQKIADAGILAVSVLITPLELHLWEDPYIEDADRRATNFVFPGFRLRWSEIFGTGLEVTVTERSYKFDNESSGDWLITEGRLDPEKQSLLDRNGDVLRIQALYRFDAARHRFEPAIRWVDDDHDGEAIANTGYSLQLTYIFASPKVILDANAGYGIRTAKEINPIYGKVFDAERRAVALKAFFPVKRYKSSVLNVFVGGELFEEETNIDFYDSSLKMVTTGVLWRHMKK